MSEGLKVSIVPLNGSNYPTWKVQCQMALVRDGLWGIVKGEVATPLRTEKEEYPKFVAKRDRALATIVLSIEPSLLYLLGDPRDPATVWRKLADQFQARTWANRLSLRRKLHGLTLKDGESVQDHIKQMIETFDALSIIGDPIDEDDRVVYLLASLPESFNMIVTALEASVDVPKMETVTERLLHEERKMKQRDADANGDAKAMTSKQKFKGKGPKCHHCGKFGHIKRNCRNLLRSEQNDEKQSQKGSKQKSNKAEVKRKNDNECVGLVVSQALSVKSGEKMNSWIVDSGATCHMCNNRKMFIEFESSQPIQEVTLGDGYSVEATGSGSVMLNMILADDKIQKCKLSNVLYVPRLSYNLLSVSMATQSGKTVKFSANECSLMDANGKPIAIAKKVDSLYYVHCQEHKEAHSAATESAHKETKGTTWHRRFGHLGVQNLKRLAKEQLVDGLDYDVLQDTDFCESCVEGKHHRAPFPSDGRKRATEPLGLVHSDVCGKINEKSLSGAEYFLTFIDDYSHYVWMYVLKHKDEVFNKFVQWKAEVETYSGRKLKVLRTDNGGEYTSKEFDAFLKTEGVRHELTVPKTPEQNGVAERMNRTLVETVRSMLADAKLPQKFWAEALATAVYLRNRSPTKAVADMTPYEAWTGEKPTVSHLRVFGCDAYAHIPKDERKKLDPKARKCILLGYGTETKGYRLYDTKQTKVFYSRDVVFNESVCGVETSEDNHEHSLMEFDCVNSEEPVVTETAEPEAETQRPVRARQPPDRYGEWATVAESDLCEPETVRDALTSPEKAKWKEAMQKEMESLYANEVWDLVELPKSKKAVGSKWVFKVKVDADGEIERHKARLVAQGYSQRFGSDYDETFSPVVRFESVRTVAALAAQHGLKLHQMDVKTAFLNGELKEEVYMKQPEGFVVKGKENLVCRLKRSLYGLKQSPRCWNIVLDEKLRKMGFMQTKSDPCIYTAAQGEMFLVAVYVDDLILGGQSDKRIREVKKELTTYFDVKDMGDLKHFLGVKIVQHPNGNIWMGQTLYTKNILEKFGMENAKSVTTPTDISAKLVKATEDSERVEQTLYQSAVGSLLYLSTRTRPDIAFAVSNVARFCSDPTKQHWTAVKRILRYLNGTQTLGLLYSKNSTEKECVGYSDADWAGDLDDRKSVSGYMFKMSGAAVSWRSKKQACVALSTAEAEYMALASAAQEAVWMRQLLSDLKNCPKGATVIYEDNQSAICMAKNPQFHGRAKHIDIKHHFIREQVASGAVDLKYCGTDDMIADMLTKGLTQAKFTKLREMAGLKPLV